MMKWLAGSSLAMAIALGSPSVNASVVTTFSFTPDNTAISWVTCGSVSGGSGCFLSGSLQNFGRVCAMMEGQPVTESNRTTRAIYVLDSHVANDLGVTLNVFTQSDFLTGGFDVTVFTWKRKIILPIAGGSKAHCLIAADLQTLYIGTVGSSSVTMVNKKDFSQTQVGGFSPSIPLTSIFANPDGNVAANFGSSSNDQAFILFGPNGEDGGGSGYILDTRNGLVP